VKLESNAVQVRRIRRVGIEQDADDVPQALQTRSWRKSSVIESVRSMGIIGKRTLVSR